MNDFAHIGLLNLTVRPLTDPPTPGNRRSQFKATFMQTRRLLARELEMLDATRIVLEVGVRDRDLRLDGLPRAGAKLETPAIALAFDSKWGPQRYATGEFTDWTDNLRAIALSLEALRAVDRYGVSRRGEQYQGWRAIPMSTDPADRIETQEQARDLLEQYGSSEDDLGSALRKAVRATHPDHNPGKGDGEFRAVMKAKEVLGL